MNFIIRNYASKISREDIARFGLENGITISSSEADYLYQLVNDNLDDLLYGDIYNISKDLEKEFGREKALKIKDLFLEYKEKYKDYL